MENNALYLVETPSQDAGMDVKLLQEILGHASAAITLDVYTSVEDASKRAACSLIQAAM